MARKRDPAMKIVDAALPAAFREEPADDLNLCDVTIEGGRIALVEPAAGLADGIDAAGGILVPAFVDMHTHLDKGHIWPRTPNPDGTFAGALAATGEDHRFWSADDLRARMTFALETAYARGTAAIRTHIDSMPPQDAISWPVFAELRAEWAGRITLQGASLMGIEGVPDDPGPLFDHVTRHGGIVGAVLYAVPPMQAKVARLMEEAEARGLDIDFHVDENLDPASNCLAVVAAEAKRIGFSGTITCGHCCSLMAMDESTADRTLDAVAEAGISIVSLPMCNQYLQDRRAGRTPRIRGGTLVHEMAARGIPVAIASDNTRDPFYAYGDLDMVEVWREATRILHLDHPVGAWPLAFSATPAAIMGLPDRDRLAPGAPADVVLFKARSWTELFARPQYDRIVIRNGAVLEAAPPDYCELDGLWISPR
ncbi:cytosine deaminase [Acuticoccus sp. M5D2P5]|uniref:cytosine deaminase n=1 Tax=Acuticoccus kalidii TaxID=2910977 RepID=UPI001F3BAD3B|nr:cytosine deaminase [Acuticoccus kalidii]MCF3934182.1 cytosine deaminase [Acuticoccus kalidii]